jgi:hypothetical protein
VPDRELEVRRPRLLHGRQVGQHVEARARGHGEGLDRVALDLRHRVGGLVAEQVDLAGNEVVHGRSRAAVGDLRELDPESLLQEQVAEVRVRADARMRRRHLGAFGLEAR